MDDRAHRSPRPFLPSLVTLVLVALSLAVGRSDAGDVPDAAALSRLGASIRPSTQVRVVGLAPRFVCYGATLSPDGVGFREAFRFGATEAQLPKPPVPWSQVTRLEMGHTQVARGALIGAIFGVVLGAMWNRMDPANESRSGAKVWWNTPGSADGATHIALTTVAGAALGAAIGSATKRWEAVYPATDR